MKPKLQANPNGRLPPDTPEPSANGHVAAPLTPSADGASTGGKDPTTGKFLPGNQCGRGNPHYRKLAENRAAFLEAVSPTQVKALAGRLLAQALAGDVDAARLVLAYAVGRPQAAVDPDAADRDAWQRHLAGPVFADVLAETSRLTCATALDVIGRLREGAEPKPLWHENDGPDAVTDRPCPSADGPG
jgi:hypothetical protein